MPTLAIIGVGGMGGTMAGSVLAAGRPLVVCDRDPSAVARLVAAGAEAADTPLAAARRVDVVAVVVVNDAQVRQVVCEGTDAIWAIHSTVSPETVVEVGERALVLDAPVTGGQPGAERGELAIMVGGDAALLERARPAFEPYASLIVHLGGLGAGQRAKLARNLVTYAELAVADEVRRLVEAAGLDGDAFRAVVTHSDRTMPVHGGLLHPEPWLHGTSAEIPHKDLRAALALAQQLDLDLPVARLIDQRIEAALGLLPQS